MLIMCQHVCSATRMHLSGCAYHLAACAQCYANTLQRACLSFGSMCALLGECAGAGALIICQHVCSARRVHWSGRAYHVPACAQCEASTLERARVSSVSLCAVLGEYVMCQRACSATHMHLSGCACNAPAYVQWNTTRSSLERVRLSCASMCALLGEYTGAGALIMCRHVCSATRIHLRGRAYHAPA